MGRVTRLVIRELEELLLETVHTWPIWGKWSETIRENEAIESSDDAAKCSGKDKALGVERAEHNRFSC